LSAIGIIANTRIVAAGRGEHEWKVWAANFLAHVIVTVAAYLVMLPRLPRASLEAAADRDRLTGAQLFTAAVVTAWVLCQLFAGTMARL
jgi:hypothetical protein